LFNQPLGFKKSIAKQDIRSLLFIKSYWYSDSDFNSGKRLAEFRINGGNQKKISLGGTGGGIKYKDEVYWLASEISNWLDMPLDVLNHDR
jgi:hypothetical protein